ncbi:hypothetical protein BU16DRAFT_50377 [Lophium mytilinum]|uniref:Uncharacterized protein n=1 Tax=Lophium mytilinum TaxID=390894 RepID=A0A6A6QQW0_9PEZI|nr:hypothetical protein BU16DRAFT_50377 [Lophium mytilinum]
MNRYDACSNNPCNSSYGINTPGRSSSNKASQHTAERSCQLTRDVPGRLQLRIIETSEVAAAEVQTMTPHARTFPDSQACRPRGLRSNRLLSFSHSPESSRHRLRRNVSAPLTSPVPFFNQLNRMPKPIHRSPVRRVDYRPIESRSTNGRSIC